MSLISNSDLQAIGDKLARYGAMVVGDVVLSSGYNAGWEKAAAAVLTGAGGIATYLIALADEDVMADLLPAARDLDETHAEMPDKTLKQIALISSMLNALDTHVKRYGPGPQTLDAYLSSLNSPTPTLRFASYFRKYLGRLSPGNVFIPTDLPLAEFDETGAAAGTFSELATIDSTLYSGAKLVAKNFGALNSSAVISVTAKKLDGTSAVLTATLTTHTDAAETNLSDTTMKFVRVTNITMASGGTSLDKFKIVAKSDRDVVAA